MTTLVESWGRGSPDAAHPNKMPAHTGPNGNGYDQPIRLLRLTHTVCFVLVRTSRPNKPRAMQNGVTKGMPA